jgi:hypothetical protein
MFIKYLGGIGAATVPLIICVIAQVSPSAIERGGEWLSWNPGERATYADGFITGYLHGSQEACEVAEQLFGEPGKMYSLGDEHHPSEMPSARCLARIGKYSKIKFTDSGGLDYGAYTDVITEFYTKHPEYRGIPFANIMDSLSDNKYKTADQLYQMALKGEWPLRPVP